MKRKIFAAFLSLMMVISMLPTSAFATEVDVPADCQHENAHWETVKEATCTEPGKEVKHCHDCEKDLEEREIPALGHDLQPTGEFVDPTCTEGAGEVYACSRCDYTETKVIEGDAAIPALGHDMKETVVSATCKEGGYTLHECTRCDYSFKDNETKADENAHNVVLVNQLRPADCKTGTNGIGRYECSICGKNFGYKTIPADHTKAVAERVEPTCKDAGKVTYKCSVCGIDLPDEEEVLPATGKHTFVDGEFIDATCTENAKEGQKCSVCGAAGETKEIPGTALGHDEVTDEEKSKAATCTEDGLEVIKCKRCGEVLENIEIPATGHKYKSTGYKAATCQSAGGEGFECTVCHDTYVEPFTGDAAEPATGHTEEEIPAVAPTCTTTGLTAGVKCAVCGEILVAQEKVPVDADAHVPVVAKKLKDAICGKQNGINRMECQLCHANLGYEVVDASEHKAVEVSRVEATCGKDGVINYKCERCGVTLEPEVIPATGEHTFDKDNTDYIKTVDATCTEKAKVIELCTVCGAEGKTTEVGTALGHDLVLDKDNENYKPATCEEDGLNTMKCTRCDYTEEQVEKATGKHVWDDGENVDADCTHASGAKYTCTKCGATKFEAYPEDIGEAAKGHTPVAIPAVAATCKTTGLTEGSECAVCHEILVAQEEVPVDADAHVPVVAKKLKDAICGKQNGINRMECQLCHANLGYEVVDASEHKAVEVSRVEATCGKDGVINYKCERCGVTLEPEVIPATGEHTFDKDNTDYIKTVDATCVDNEKIVYLCTVCGAESEPEELEGSALGHKKVLDETDPAYKAVSCEEDGLNTYKCERCGEKLEPEVEKATGKHQWNEGKPVNASCTEDEHIVVECTICHKTESRELPGGQKALGHDYKKDVTPATCAKEGYTTVTCSRCDYHDITDKTPVDPNNHTWKITHLKDASCTATGIDRRVCVDCGKSEYIVSDKLAHVYNDDNAVITDPTCVTEGKISNTCTVCGKTDVVGTIPATGKHTPVEIPETDTMSAGEKCSVCGTILKEPVKKADCEHKNLVPIDEVPATCTSTGLSVGLKCADCGKIIEAQTVTPKLDHTVVEIPAKEATCTEDGLTAGEECSVCHTVLKAQETVKAAGHKAVEVPAVEATCTSTGLTAGEKCSVCNEVLKAQETVPMKEHTVVEIPAKEATCTETGLTAGKECSVCHKVLKAQETVPMKKHTEEIIEAVAATCTEAGHKEGEKCSVCGTILMEPETVEALGHDYTEYVGAGEDDKGAYLEYKCSRCDATEKQYAE